MITLDEAKRIMKELHPEDSVVRVCETPDMYVLGLSNDDEGYDTIHKLTGEIGFIWYWEFADLYDSGWICDLRPSIE